MYKYSQSKTRKTEKLGGSVMEIKKSSKKEQEEVQAYFLSGPYNEDIRRKVTSNSLFIIAKHPAYKGKIYFIMFNHQVSSYVLLVKQNNKLIELAQWI